MSTGTTFKQCGCRDESHRQAARPHVPEAAARQRLEPRPRHLVLPARAPAARRRHPPPPAAQGRLRHQGPTPSAELDQARDLLAIAAPGDPPTAIRIADAITAAMRDTRTLPDPDRVRKAVGGGRRPGRQAACRRGVAGGMAGRQEEAAARHRAQLRRAHPPVPQAAPRAHPRRPAPGHRHRRPCSTTSTNSTTRSPRPAPAGSPARRAAVKGRRLVGPATCQRIRATLRSAISTYMRQHPGVLPANVASLAELPPGDPAQGAGLDRRAGPRLAGRLRRPARRRPRSRRPGQPRRHLGLRPAPVPGHGLDPRPDHGLPRRRPPAPAARAVAADRHPGAAPRRGLRAAPPRHRPGRRRRHDPLADHPARLGPRPGRPEVRRRRAHRRPRRRHRHRHDRLAPGTRQGEGSRRGRLGRLRVRVHRRDWETRCTRPRSPTPST